MASITVKAGQNLTDIAIAYMGDPQGVFSLAAANGLSVTDDLAPGQILVLPEVVNAKVVRKLNEFLPQQIATSDQAQLDGIDYWGIEFSFVVQ